MAKFVIECPSCGRYNEASTGFFAKRKVECGCGNIINVKTDKMALTDCPHCGNNVLYDQSKGEKALCPVCKEPLNKTEDKFLLVDLTCPSCACKLSIDKNLKDYSCPLCDTKFDVQERITKENIKKRGEASLIKYEGGNETFVWKHPIEDFNLGSQLIVHESQEALFFRDGRAMDLFGSGRYTLAEDKLPELSELYKTASMDEVYHSEIYFINMVTQMGIKWGTDTRVRTFDPASGLHIEIGACGTFNLRVINSRKLVVKLVGTTSELKQDDLTGGFGISLVVGKFKSLIMNKVKSNLARIIKENNINILEIDGYMDVISEKLKVVINETLEDYGMNMPEFLITSILTPDDDPNFRRLKAQFAEKTLRLRDEEIRKAEAEAAQSRKILEAQTEAQIKMVGAQGEAEMLKMRAMAEAEAYRAQAYAEADEMRAKGYTYQQETARMVGMEAMQNGITGNGAGGGSFGDIVNLGMTVGTMGTMIDMTKSALDPVTREAKEMGQALGGNGASAGWDCECGQKGILSNFCPNCGTKKPEPKTWNCSCGNMGNTTNFCPNCGAKKSDASEGWDCQCGQKGIKTNFCPNCGTKKGE